jgi:hypothetical protein
MSKVVPRRWMDRHDNPKWESLFEISWMCLKINQ